MTAGTWTPHDSDPICDLCYDTGVRDTFDHNGRPMTVTCEVCHRSPRW